MIIRFPGGLRKALTLSYDDGVEQDVLLMDILRRHGLKCTFNLNSGCFAAEGTIWPAGQVHRRMTERAAAALYLGSGHEVAVHTLTHPDLTKLQRGEVIHEVDADRRNLERIFGGIVRGAAYPFGTYSDEVVDALRACGIVYCRTVYSSHDFALPADWLRLRPTCHHDDPALFELADRFLAGPAEAESLLFYLWGHAYEFEANDNWQRMEDFAARVSGRDDVWYATNIDIWTYLDAAARLVPSADGRRVLNPSARPVWVESAGSVHEIAPGSCVEIG